MCFVIFVIIVYELDMFCCLMISVLDDLQVFAYTST